MPWSAARHRAQAKLARSIPGITGRVHENDSMLVGETPEWAASYMAAGTTAMASIERGLVACGRDFSDIGSCLDFGCGYGRVVRHLCQKIPPKQITACDQDPVAIRFCEAEFGVRARRSSFNFDRLRLGRYDLIWVGSVFTHLPQSGADRLWQRLVNALRGDGVIVFSIHGEWSVTNLAQLYGPEHAGDAPQILDEYRRDGFSFRPYKETFGSASSGSYGITWMSPSYVESRIAALFGEDVRLHDFNPQGWHGHHDVYTVQRQAR